MQDQTQNKVSKPTINQRFEAWKQKQGRTRIVLFWSGLWTFTALFCLAGWFMIHAAQPPTKFEFFTMAIVGIGCPCVWPLVVFRHRKFARVKHETTTKG